MSVKPIFGANAMPLPKHLPRRLSVRPQFARRANFDQDFDGDTLYFDALRLPGKIKIVAPPFNNLEPLLAASHFSRVADNVRLPHKVWRFDRQVQIEVASNEEVEWTFGGETVPIVCSAQSTHLFAGRRTVFTLTKNNPLRWIKDWARFYRDVHGADAILLFDNGSTAYGSEALLDALAAVDGLKSIAVVDWPFKYGPRGYDAKRYWDSDFCQLAALEVARWRFLAEARSVVNCDIDELVVSDGGRSVFDYTEHALSGVVRFLGDWVVGLDGLTRGTDADLTFTDFVHMTKPTRGRKFGVVPIKMGRCRSKWAVVPSRCPPHAQWHIHTIKGTLRAIYADPHFAFAHFREINTNWKYDRSERATLDPAIHSRHERLLEAYAKVDWQR